MTPSKEPHSYRTLKTENSSSSLSGRQSRCFSQVPPLHPPPYIPAPRRLCCRGQGGMRGHAGPPHAAQEKEVSNTKATGITPCRTIGCFRHDPSAHIPAPPCKQVAPAVAQHGLASPVVHDSLFFFLCTGHGGIGATHACTVHTHPQARQWWVFMKAHVMCDVHVPGG